MRLWNTYSRKKEEFKPIVEGQVSMYHCGPTVYDYVHIGNLRAFFLADIIRKTFEFLEYEVKQVINITDIGNLSGSDESGGEEDKMTKALVREGKPLTIESMRTLGEFYTETFFEDLKNLNIKTTDTRFPRASDYLKEQITLIEKLEKKEYAYKISDGVYFDTKKFPSYGTLGALNTEGAREGARIETNPEKRNPSDFVLWKFSKNETGYKSPWGVGFPGWHIECSAMSMALLGETVDIHTAGIDLSTIHHNNEIAQSEGATGKQFVHYWVHNAFLNIEGDKMAKSEGTGITLQTLIEKGYSPLAYRYFLLQGNYRTPLNFTWEAIEAAENALDKLYENFEELGTALGEPDISYMKKMTEKLEDNFNTPESLAIMWELIKDSTVGNAEKRATLLEFDRVLSLNMKGHTNTPIPVEIKQRLLEREDARKTGDFKKADMLRHDIEEQGYRVKDTDAGPVVHRI